MLCNMDSLDESSESSVSRQCFEHLPCGILIVEPDGTISYGNKQSEMILGYEKEELQGLSVEELVPPSLKKSHIDLRGSFMKNPVAREMGKSKDLYACKKDGSQVAVEIGLAPFNFGKKNQVICCISDISLRKAMENRLETHTQELKRSNSELDHFAYTVSHDLKEPLRGLLTLVEFFREDYGGQLEEEALNNLDRITEQGCRMGNLIDTLLDYSRLGRKEINPDHVSILQLAEEAKLSLESFIKDQNAEVIISPDLPPAFCDSTLIHEVFLNLITNGIKYNESAKKIITIFYDEKKDTYIVEDNGIGIEEGQLGKVFQAFSRLNSKCKNVEGTGLGMAIVKKIISKHKGEIWIKSKVDQGTKVYLQLPHEAQKKE